MKIGLLSDTHGHCDARIAGLFAGVAHILHAGDIGREAVLDELRAIAPVTAVLGNTDHELRGSGYREVERRTLGGRKFFVVHVGRPHDLAADVKRMIFEEDKPDMVLFGHTHHAEKLVVGGVTFFNPGGAGRARFGQPRSVAVAEIGAGGVIETRWLPLE
ncbi:MAG: metallophosphoesterase family protein [Verrucomicrobia bacterium]|nr:metallophosphoesterase family protein [Verrucomicrobiota bacterium]